MPAPIYYHGGVPGAQVGDLLHPAADLGLDYTSAYEHPAGVQLIEKPKYRPHLVYFTTHAGSAYGYAARYAACLRAQQGDRYLFPVPGDLYTVSPQGAITSDPDFDHPKTAGVYLASPDPLVITGIVERDIHIDRREQNQLCWPYRYYGLWEETHSSDGTVLASTEMRRLGVTDDYLALLPKWMDQSEYSNAGRLWMPWATGIPASPDHVLDILSHLNIDTGPHLITSTHIQLAPSLEAPVLYGYLECQHCRTRFGKSDTPLDKQTALDAAVHQAGNTLRLVAKFNGGLDGYLHAMTRRSPERWTWTWTKLEPRATPHHS